jgi:hypothetical protein
VTSVPLCLRASTVGDKDKARYTMRVASPVVSPYEPPRLVTWFPHRYGDATLMSSRRRDAHRMEPAATTKASSFHGERLVPQVAVIDTSRKRPSPETAAASLTVGPFG